MLNRLGGLISIGRSKLTMLNLSYTLLIILTATLVVADDFVEQFERASAKRFSPGVELEFSSLPTESIQLDQKLTKLSKAGFNSILLKSIPAESNSWQQLADIAEGCRVHSMTFGCSFFLDESVKGGYGHLLRKLGWTSRVVDIHNYTTNGIPVFVPHCFEASSFALVLAPVTPHGDKYSTAGNVVVGRDSLPKLGMWHSFQFFSYTVQPLLSDYLNQDVFIESINNFLLEAQQQLDRNYGNVLNWVWFPSLSNSELIWTDGMERWFAEHAALDLIRYLPVLAGVDVKSAAFSQVIRQRYQQGVKRLWRDRFALNVKVLLQEAGLNAGIAIDEIPLDPEEAGGLFNVTLLNGRSNICSRVRNRRAAGGARVLECKNVVGRVDPSSCCQSLKATVDYLFIDGADKILFDENILDFKGCAEFAKTHDLVSYIRRLQIFLQNSNQKSGFLLCSDTIPKILNQYSFDCANVKMLRSAETHAGHLSFASGRRYATVVFNEVVLCSEAGKELVQDFQSKGVRVLYLADASGAEIKPAKEVIVDQRIKKFGEIKNLPELLPDLSWISDQSQIDIRFIHRENPQRNFYLIKNESSAAGMVTLTFKATDFKRVSRWQPKDGRVYEINNFARIDKFRTSIPSLVRPGEIFFIVFEL